MGAGATAKWEMIEAGGRTAQSFGLGRLLGQIYVLLYLSPQAMTLDELAAELGISKASASIACRQLEALGALRHQSVKGDRRDFYQAETDFRALIQGGLLPSLLKKLESARRQIERSMGLVLEGGEDGQETAFLLRRLRDAEARRGKLERLIRHPVLKRLL